VFRLSPEEALVATLDFFTPVVDDPYVYGAIAAANSLSDVYAMGGEPLFALAVAAFPDDEKVLPLLADVMAGAADKAKEAGICIIGGHTVRDKEPKFGLSVTGRVHPERMWTNRGAKPGDVIVLTKPIGTGIVTTAIKWEISPQETTEAAIRSMARLSSGVARAGREAGIHTATDVTGFGLLGHLIEVLEGSGLCAEIRVRDIPVFPGVRDLMKRRTLAAISTRTYVPGASISPSRSPRCAYPPCSRRRRFSCSPTPRPREGSSCSFPSSAPKRFFAPLRTRARKDGRSDAHRRCRNPR
jgi:selenide,water dikinase